MRLDKADTATHGDEAGLWECGSYEPCRAVPSRKFATSLGVPGAAAWLFLGEASLADLRHPRNLFLTLQLCPGFLQIFLQGGLGHLPGRYPLLE